MANPKKTPTAPTPPISQAPRKMRIREFEFQLNLNSLLNRGVLYLFLAVLFLPFILSLFGDSSTQRIGLSELIRDVKSEKITKLMIAGNDLRAEYQDGKLKVASK